MGHLDIDVSLPDGSTNTVSELDDYIRATRSALVNFGTAQHDSSGKHQIPSGTTAARNASSSPPHGMLWINTTTGNIDWYNGNTSTWTAGFTGAGAGDMLIATYDADADGVVESADQITDGGVNIVTALQARTHIDDVTNPYDVDSTQVDLVAFAGGVYQLDEMLDGSFVVDVRRRQMFARLSVTHNRRMAV